MAGRVQIKKNSQIAPSGKKAIVSVNQLRYNGLLSDKRCGAPAGKTSGAILVHFYNENPDILSNYGSHRRWIILFFRCIGTRFVNKDNDGPQIGSRSNKKTWIVCYFGGQIKCKSKTMIFLYIGGENRPSSAMSSKFSIPTRPTWNSHSLSILLCFVYRPIKATKHIS